MENLKTVEEHLTESVKFLVKLAASRETAGEEAKQKHYQDVVLESVDIKSKSISADKALAWSGLPSTIFLANKPRSRNSKRTKTYWGVDVVKWLCELWHRDYPEKYINECYALNIDPKTGDFKKA